MKKPMPHTPTDIAHWAARLRDAETLATPIAPLRHFSAATPVSSTSMLRASVAV